MKVVTRTVGKVSDKSRCPSRDKHLTKGDPRRNHYGAGGGGDSGGGGAVVAVVLWWRWNGMAS